MRVSHNIFIIYRKRDTKYHQLVSVLQYLILLQLTFYIVLKKYFGSIPKMWHNMTLLSPSLLPLRS